MPRTLPTLPLALATLFGVAACASSGPPAGEAVEAPVPEIRTLREPPPIEAGRAAENPGDYAPGIDVLHYDVELALAPTGTEIWGRAHLDVEVAEEADGRLVLDVTGLGLREILVDGTPVTWEYAQGRLELPVEEGRHRVRVAYAGTPDDGLILRDNVHGDWAVFADNWPNRARFWFPSVDHPSDKASVAFTVHAPEGWEVIANGLQRPEATRTPAGTLTDLGYLGPIAHRTWRYRTDVDIPVATMVVGAADFAIHTVGQACANAPVAPGGCVEVTSWSFPADSARAASIFARADQMVDYYAELIGPFPYEKLANVQSSTRFGGMENSSAIFYSESAIAQGRLSEGTVAHEIAHQWFGDSVTEFDWSHLWLSEGFATYFGALFFEHADGVEPFRATMERSRQRIVGSNVVATRPVIETDQPDLFALLNDNNYPKGGWVLHMLRGWIGDDAFFDGIRRFYARYRDDIASTDDFREVMEEASGRDLERFFDQWLNHPGFPVLRSEWQYDASLGQVQVTVHQEQDAAWPGYHLPLTVRAVLEDGSHVDHAVEMDGREGSASFAVTGPVQDVIVDPDGWILKDVP